MPAWLPGAKVVDLHPSIGNGPFGDCYGVILHVNVSPSGTPDSFWGNGNAGQVCPNFQVYKDGSIHQMLPIDWQPWCQKDGNFHYAAIETAGMPDEPLTPAQVAACAKILRTYHDQLGVPLRLANAPGQRGLGTHQMGGNPWGGHSCPGTLRAAQRNDIIAAAKGATTPANQEGDIMPQLTEAKLRELVREESDAAVRRVLHGDVNDDKVTDKNPSSVAVLIRDEVRDAAGTIAAATVAALVDSGADNGGVIPGLKEKIDAEIAKRAKAAAKAAGK